MFYFCFDQYFTSLNVFVSFRYRNNSISKLYYRRTCIIVDIPKRQYQEQQQQRKKTEGKQPHKKESFLTSAFLVDTHSLPLKWFPLGEKLHPQQSNQNQKKSWNSCPPANKEDATLCKDDLGSRV